MRSVAVCGKLVKDFAGQGSHFEQIELDGVSITCGLIHTEQPNFDSQAIANESSVLVNIKAFSCNFRDKALMFAALNKGLEKSYYVVGSEFVGQVVAVGSGVVDLAVEDRVIGNNCYVGFMADANGVLEGVTTNHASKEYQVFHQSKLIRIPAQMPDTIAAAFSLNSQTAYSMLRKLELKAGSKILVTAAKSNVSLFILNALRKYDVDVFATSTSLNFETRLKELGVAGLIKINNTPDGSVDQQLLHQSASRVGPFDCVIDPFFDIHFSSALGLMAPGGRYITCGFVGPKQGSGDEPDPHRGPTIMDSMAYAVFKNLQFIGNCLGSTEDLNDAIRDFARGSYNVIIDSVYHGDQIGSFFDRTYSVRDRFGKVVYVFD
jgi:NADPH:quinone reductase-like Zn-dependent oxidoreductase